MKSVNSKQYSVISRGFTLIELLVVISVIGILAALILARFGTVEKSARDARRKSDLNQYRTALENYGIKYNGLYPSYYNPGPSPIDASGSLCTKLGTDYISSCLQDPRQDGTTYFYRYQSNGTGSGTVTATQYILWVKMETGTTAVNYWYLCANGKAAEKPTTAPAASDCGF